MKKIVLIDGNNFMFRAFYAIRDNGGNLRTSFGLSTNALYGFRNMIKKIIDEEKPEYICVAFDKGKNFRKEEYSFYKEGRKETPSDLKEQFPISKEMLDCMGITYLELEPYEADDIIGTLAKMVDESSDFTSLIVSSDLDLTQLISEKNTVKLLKKEPIRYTLEKFVEEYSFEPIKMIDLKSIMGDSSDNIPGVKGIGEKGARKLLEDYNSLEGVYENIDNIKGSTKEKLINDKESAYVSKKLATIYKDVPLNLVLDDLKYKGDTPSLNDLYKKLEFKSFIKKDEVKKEISVKEINSIDELNLENNISLYAEFDDVNYHTANLLGVTITDINGTYFVKKELVYDLAEKIKGKKICTYNAKKVIGIFGDIFSDDLMISEFLLNKNVKDDISNIIEDIDSEYTFAGLKKKKYIDLINACGFKSLYIFNEMNNSLDNLKKENLYDLYEKIELPLMGVLYAMEENGIVCDSNVLYEMKEKIVDDINKITLEIYALAGEEFNINSPMQLGNIIFEKLEIGKGKKNKNGYVTDAAALEKLKGKHEIIDKILQYRNLAKINSTYIEGIIKYIDSNKLVKPIFNQTLARTGRLSCSEPNLQNIPVREELGKQIRKAFVPMNDFFLSADYSQIELRILAHISGDEKLIDSFNKDKDIHRSVAADMYGKNEEDITKAERKTAKAVIFGIVYGISGFGLGENLGISRKEASDFINKYLELYPSVKNYMDDIIHKTKETGYVTTLYNRKRKIDEIKSSAFMLRQMGERMALNTPIQGSSADIIKVAMIKIQEEINKYNLKSKMILQVHDELIFDTLESEAQLLEKIVKDNMENVIKLSVPLKVEISTGKNWYEV